MSVRDVDGALATISRLIQQKRTAVEELEQIRQDYPYFAAELDRVVNILLAPTREEP